MSFSRAAILRFGLALGVVIASCVGQYWLLVHNQQLWPGLPGHTITAVFAVAGLAAVFFLTRRERHNRER